MDQTKVKIDQACRIAEEFTKLYYDTVDKRRHVLHKLYLDTGLLAWNGNGVTGSENIQKFIIDLPPSDHSVITLDAQPILGNVLTSLLHYLIIWRL
ncbi:hypothetical protein NQ317_010975 [Molorchus minor]|uniref:NTF2 domain-containing protein n=1 Tax=Molorchus minor TaxID=1323400 RepID=A0ABQ9J2I9_9CUCU|nr:hypothetical protein NQ317_010975 [Molorchus minor]